MRFSRDTYGLQVLVLYLVNPEMVRRRNRNPLVEFISVIESSARIRLWEYGDQLQIAALRLTDVTRQFYNGSLELHSSGVTWQKFKDGFRRRFRDTQTDQYHFVILHTARQGRNKTSQEFAERCWAVIKHYLQGG
jgi:hypothetical protein